LNHHFGGADTAVFLDPPYRNFESLYSTAGSKAVADAEVIRRDGGRCASCKTGGDLDVHHRVPFREFTDIEMANRIENLVALCRPCHARADAEYRSSGAIFPLHTAAVAK
jgi:hypothetical protein